MLGKYQYVGRSEPTDHEERLIHELAAYWSHKVHEIGTVTGWTYRPAPDAPDTYPALVAAMTKPDSRPDLAGVFRECSHSLYAGTITPGEHGTVTDPNVHFRFVHDMEHFSTGRSFTFADEAAVIDSHLSDALRHGVSPEAVALLRCDTFGQLRFGADHGGFLTDQRTFVLDMFRHGYEAAACAAVIVRTGAQ